MEISKRLQAVAAFVSYPAVADIGTDHGYVPIYLHKTGKISRAIACDVRRGPLQRAQENIRQYSCEDSVETRLGSGLEPLQPGEVETAVIAGMGGMLTVRLLQDSPEVVASLRELILAPQQDVPAVRRYLHGIGFAIREEQLIREDGKYYNIMQCVPERECYEREMDYLYGKRLLEKKHPLLLEWLGREDDKLRLLEERLMQTATAGAQERLRQMKEERALIREALECMQQ